ncbi:MAG: aldo/keto reductase [Candidatus Paceibacterota bacterium]
MKYRKLGKTDLLISEIGYGTWQIANDPGLWVGADIEESEACLKEFVARGGNFIDTAWVYGWNAEFPNKHPSEELIGSFLKKNNLKEKIIIATKIPPKNMKWPAWKGIPIEEIFPIDHIRKCVDDSLKSLQLDRIDLMQFHVWQDDFILSNEWKETLKEITKQGKVRYWGISVNDYQPSNCIKALDTGLFSSIQLVFNIFHQKPIDKIFPYAKKNNIGIIARVPLDEGGLSGKFSEDTIFAEGDFRGKYFTKERLKELSIRTDRLSKICKKYNIESIPELALRFILSYPQISTVIPGMRKMNHLKSNLSVSEKGSLEDKILKDLEIESWERNFYPDVDPSLKNSNYLA